MTADLDVVFVDNHLLVLNKPAGVPTVPDRTGDESLLDRARAWVKTAFDKPGRVFLGVVQRLDRPVSGVVVFARTSKAAGRLSDQIRRRAVLKTYWGVCAGGPPEPDGRLEQWLVKDSGRNVVTVTAEPPDECRAKLAITRWRVLGQAGDRTLVELVPETGRPHQLRVAAASWGCPLLGDTKYGAPRALPDRSVALHARALELAHPTRSEPLVFEVPPPPAAWWRFDHERSRTPGRP